MAGAGRGQIIHRIQDFLKNQGEDSKLGKNSTSMAEPEKVRDPAGAPNEAEDDFAACLEAWNPMEEDFRDPEFNSYDSGPGKDLPLDAQRPPESGQRRQKRSNLQLYVTGIPLEMTEKGLTNLFSRAGEVVEVRKIRSKMPNRKDTYGFVTFRSIEEIEMAMRLLDGFKIGDCVMRVRVALSAEERAARSKAQTQNIRMVDEEDVGEEPEIPEPPEPESDKEKPASDGETLLHSTDHSSVEGDSSRRTENVANPSSTEKVELEKAPHTTKASTPPVPKKDSSTIAKPQNVMKVTKKPGPCQHCGKHAKKYCQRCCRPYCGITCQKADWPRHKLTCQKPLSEFEARFEVADDHVDEMIEECLPPKSTIKEVKENEEYIAIKYSEVKRESLLTNDLTEVYITSTDSPSHIWVTNVENEPLKAEIQAKLAKLTQAKDQNFKPFSGCFCAAIYDGEWYRAVINEINPAKSEAVVTYVDFGNSAMVPYKNLSRLHRDLINIPSQAVPCNLSIRPVEGWSSWRTVDIEEFVKLIQSQETFKVNVEGQAGDVIYTKFYLRDGRHVAQLMVLNKNAQEEEKPSSYKPNPTKSHVKEPEKKGKVQAAPIPSHPKSPSSDVHWQGTRPPQHKVQSPDQRTPRSPHSTRESPHAIPPRQQTSVPQQARLTSPTHTASRKVDSQIPFVVSPVIDLGQELEVKLCHVKSIDEFWIRIIDEEVINSFNKMFGELQECYNNKKKKALFKTPKHRLLAAYDSRNGEWHRAQLIDFDLKGVQVYLFDQGISRTVDLTEVHNLDSPFCSVPAQALRCELQEISPIDETWSGDAVDCFVDYVRVTECSLVARIVECRKDAYIIDLRNPYVDCSLKESLIGMGFATHGKALHAAPKGKGIPEPRQQKPPCESIVMASDVPKCELPVSPTLHDVIIRNSTSPSELIICETQAVEEFDTYLDRIDTLLSDYKGSYKPIMVCELVFVRDEEGHWWRSEILAINMDKSAMVRSLDNCKVTTAKRDQMACVPSDLEQVPVISMQCTLHGISGLADGKSWQNDIVPRLQGKTLKAQIRARKGALHAVDLYSEIDEGLMNLNKWLVKEGLLLDDTCPKQRGVTKNWKAPTPVKLAPPTMRTIAPPKPTMIALPKLQATSPQKPPVFTDRMQTFSEAEPVVIVGESSDPGKFYCQLKSKVDELREFEEKFRGDYPKKGRKRVPSSLGDVVAALNTEDNKWYRAQVLDARFKNTERILVRFVDYGQKDLVEQECIQEIEEKHLQLDFQGIRCCLKFWDTERNDSDDLAAYFKSALEGQIVKLKVSGREDGIYVIKDIMNVETNVSLFSKAGPLSKLAAGMPDKTEEDKNKPQHDVPKVFTGVLSSFESFEDFSLQFNEDKITELQDDIDVLCQMTPFDPKFNPETGDICCSQYRDDGMWYRAIVVSKTTKLFSVRFIDYGNCQTVEAPFLRPISNELVGIPPQAIRCSLSGLVQPEAGWTKEDTTRFEDLTYKSKLEVEVVKVIDSIHWVHLKHPTHGDLSTILTKGP